MNAPVHLAPISILPAYPEARLTGTTVLNTSPGPRSAAGDGALAVLLSGDVPSAAARPRTE